MNQDVHEIANFAIDVGRVLNDLSYGGSEKVAETPAPSERGGFYSVGCDVELRGEFLVGNRLARLSKGAAKQVKSVGLTCLRVFVLKKFPNAVEDADGPFLIKVGIAGRLGIVRDIR